MLLYMIKVSNLENEVIKIFPQILGAILSIFRASLDPIDQWTYYS